MHNRFRNFILRFHCYSVMYTHYRVQIRHIIVLYLLLLLQNIGNI